MVHHIIMQCGMYPVYMIPLPPCLQLRQSKTPMHQSQWAPPCSLRWACHWRAGRTGTATWRRPSNTTRSRWLRVPPSALWTLTGRSLWLPLMVRKQQLHVKAELWTCKICTICIYIYIYVSMYNTTTTTSKSTNSHSVCMYVYVHVLMRDER